MLSSIVLQVCESSSGGTVVFLQSYKYKKTFMEYFQSSKTFDGINKTIFEESQSDQLVFSKYKKCVVDEKKDAILFCVIGGRLSEGINFTDDLARTMIIAGLPYANSQSVEI